MVQTSNRRLLDKLYLSLEALQVSLRNMSCEMICIVRYICSNSPSWWPRFACPLPHIPVHTNSWPQCNLRNFADSDCWMLTAVLACKGWWLLSISCCSQRTYFETTEWSAANANHCLLFTETYGWCFNLRKFSMGQRQWALADLSFSLSGFIILTERVESKIWIFLVRLWRRPSPTWTI